MTTTKPSQPVPDIEMIEHLLDGSPDALLLVDSNGRIIRTNSTASTLFGYPDGLVGRSVDELVPDEYQGSHIDHRVRYAEDPQRRPIGTDLRLFGRRLRGDTFPVEVSLSPVIIGGEMHTVASVQDVTERQESRARLLLHEERERIAHELHDLIIQRLFATGMALQSVTNLIDAPVARERVVSVTDELDETVRAIRAAIFRLGVRTDQQSLASHLASLVDERSRQVGFATDLQIVGSIDDLPEFVADQLVATLTEAVSNIGRHANATEASIHISRTDNAIALLVRDNGQGIATSPKPLGGLSNLMWRAAELGGTCSVSPVEPTGTELTWRVPV
ncbi:MAG: PAS domain-containing sensor histidine kinase [Ilumatobacter sp.]